MQQFGGLHVYFPHPRATQVRAGFDFKPEMAIEALGLFVLELYPELFGNPLCTIGFQSDGIVLLMDEDGKMYGGFEALLFAIGDNPTDAIEALCAAEPLPVLINGENLSE